jgi:hypothetical protein
MYGCVYFYVVQQKTKEHMKYSYMYVYTRMISAAVLSPAIKIFHRHLGPNLLIFAVKVRDIYSSPTI